MKCNRISSNLSKIVCSQFFASGLSVAVTLASLLAMGCAETDEGNDADTSTEAPRAPVEHAGEIASGCHTEQDPATGLVAEVCDQRSLTGSPIEAPSTDTTGAVAHSNGASTEEAATATQSLAGSSVPLSATTTGAKVTATLVWKSEKSFELRNVKLTDTSCDSHSVFFHALIPGFQYPNHSNKNGCNTTATWDVLRGSSSYGIHALWLEVCRNKLIDNCATGASSVNPYCPIAC